MWLPPLVPRCVRPGLSSALLLGLVMVSLAALAARRLVSSLCCGLWPGQSLPVFCVSCLLSLVSGHLLRVSAIFGPQYLSCGYYTVPSLLRTKINGKSYLIFIWFLPSFMASHFCRTKLENNKTILGILEQSESMPFLLSTFHVHLSHYARFHFLKKRRG